MSDKDDYYDEDLEERMEAEQEVREEIDELTQDIDDELDDMYEEVEEGIEDAYEYIEEAHHSYRDVAEKLEQEKRRLEEKRERLRDKYRHMQEKLRHKAERKRINTRELEERMKEIDERINAKTEAYKSRIDALNEKLKFKRMNISVPGAMKDSWKGMADDLNTSVSEIIRKSMSLVGKALSESNLKDLSELDNLGEKIEEAVKKSGIEDIGEKIEAQINEKDLEKIIKQKYKSKGPKAETAKESVEKERLKKRVRGLIKLQKSIPIAKLAQILDISEEQAENLIYEIAAEGIEGDLEEGVFKFSTDPDEVIEVLYQLIDRI
ncbi:MAG: hypothetical protein EU548_00375 [Promethearchaeota archaeon]|nr:MAG: hypothetical protein EU548_00375 [Candidatus Lokiarchaeota archaeon]